jgi:hypothetical protein
MDKSMPDFYLSFCIDNAHFSVVKAKFSSALEIGKGFWKNALKSGKLSAHS